MGKWVDKVKRTPPPANNTPAKGRNIAKEIIAAKQKAAQGLKTPKTVGATKIR